MLAVVLLLVVAALVTVRMRGRDGSAGGSVARAGTGLHLTAGAAPLGTTGGSTTGDSTTGGSTTGDTYVVAPDGSDTAAGTAGAPWQTVKHAVQTAPSGSTVVLRAGSYHEQVTVPAGTRLTIESAPGAVVWFDGSTALTGWVQDGSAWRVDGWTARPSRADATAANGPGFRMIDPAHPLAGYPDQAFRDGTPLRQVASRAEVVPGTFFVDDATSQLFVGDDPKGHEVRASDLTEALTVNGAGSVVRGIGFRRYATPVARFAPVKGYADDLLFEDDVFTDNAAAGLSIHGKDVVVRRATLVDNGQLGLHANISDGLQVLDSKVTGNNAEHFAQIPVAGGVKITASGDVVLRGNQLTGNDGNGLWFDQSCWGAQVVGNEISDNGRHGVVVELAAQMLVVGNEFASNHGAGVRILDSSDVQVWQNTVVGSAPAVDVLDGPRDVAHPGATAETPPRPRNPIVTWAVSGIVVQNNVLSAGGLRADRPLMRVLDTTGKRPASAMLRTDDNGWTPGPSAPLVQWGVVKGASSSKPSETFRTLKAFTAKTGQEHAGATLSSAGPSAGPSSGPSSGPTPSSSSRAGAPLPADVAKALGLADDRSVPIGVVGD